MSLAQFEDKEEQDHVLDLLKKGRPFNVKPFNFIFVGGKKTSSGQWQWIGGNKPINYEINWNHGEPNNALGNENCLDLTTSENSPDQFGFNDDPCDSRRKKDTFICEKVGN